jgi:hypothetical protein
MNWYKECQIYDRFQGLTLKDDIPVALMWSGHTRKIHFYTLEEIKKKIKWIIGQLRIKATDPLLITKLNNDIKAYALALRKLQDAQVLLSNTPNTTYEI